LRGNHFKEIPPANIPVLQEAKFCSYKERKAELLLSKKDRMSKLLRNPGIDFKESITGLIKGRLSRDEYFFEVLKNEKVLFE
jgi:hypothetical protein